MSAQACVMFASTRRSSHMCICRHGEALNRCRTRKPPSPGTAASASHVVGGEYIQVAPPRGGVRARPLRPVSLEVHVAQVGPMLLSGDDIVRATSPAPAAHATCLVSARRQCNRSQRRGQSFPLSPLRLSQNVVEQVISWIWGTHSPPHPRWSRGSFFAAGNVLGAPPRQRIFFS